MKCRSLLSSKLCVANFIIRRMIMKFFKKSILFIFFTLIFSQIYATEIFNKNLTEEKRSSLEKGETVIIDTASYDKLCIESDNYAVKKIKNLMKNLKPTYLAEVIKFYPVEGNEDFIEKFDSSIMKIDDYVGIPYWSERHQQYFDLYSSAKILSSKQEGNSLVTIADLYMEPLGLINTQITTEKTSDYYYYESENLNTLKVFEKFNCISPSNMKSAIIIFKNDDQWVVYGVGAVKTADIIFLRSRIKTSFINRIKTFCTFFIDKIQ